MNHLRNDQTFVRLAKLWSKVTRIRPSILATPLMWLWRRRLIIERDGLKVFVDPASNLGQMIYRYGRYEELTHDIFKKFIRPGDVVLDIGANEGYFSALAAVLAGSNGRVIAVEPQSRLHDILEINLALNSGAPWELVPGVVAETDGETVAINLYPVGNTGATSLVRRARVGSRTEQVRTWTPEAIARQCGVDRFDFVKIDVEGFEPEVVRAFEPMLARRQVRTILLDYHGRILRNRGIDPVSIHQQILAHGYRLVEGDPRSEYTIYDGG